MSDDEINRTSHRLDHRKGEEEAKDTQFSNTTEVTEGIAAIEPEREKHEAKKDPKHAHDHKLKEEIAAAPAAVGASGFAFHEHLEKKEAAKEKHEEVHGKKHRSLFD